MIKQLRIKFVLIIMTIFTVMLTVILGMTIHFTKLNMERNSMQMLDKLATNPLHMIRPADDFDVHLPYFSIRIDDKGNIMDSISSYYNLSDKAYLQNVVSASENVSGKIGVLKEYNLRFMRVSTPKEQFVIFADMSNETATIKTLTRNCMFIGIFSFILFLGISIFFANWAVKPVDKAWKQQKQFIADASHKLKTPLTVILTNTELIQSSDVTESNKRKFADIIQNTAKNMCSLVEGLLELSRIDNGSMKTNMSLFDFSQLTQKATYVFEPVYYEKGLELCSEIAENICIKGSEAHLNQVLEILLDNALKYAYANTDVHLKLTAAHTNCLLSVSNKGDVIAQEDLKNIFKRFYRADKNQNVAGSYGLGLSIAESIVDEHGGKIWVESKDEINTFFVRIPTVNA